MPSRHKSKRTRTRARAKHVKRKRMSKKKHRGGSKTVKFLLNQALNFIKPNSDLKSFDSLLKKMEKLN